MTTKPDFRQVELNYYRQRVEHYQKMITIHPLYKYLWELCLDHSQRQVVFYEEQLGLREKTETQK